MHIQPKELVIVSLINLFFAFFFYLLSWNQWKYTVALRTVRFTVQFCVYSAARSSTHRIVFPVVLIQNFHHRTDAASEKFMWQTLKLFFLQPILGSVVRSVCFATPVVKRPIAADRVFHFDAFVIPLLGYTSLLIITDWFYNFSWWIHQLEY